MSEFVSFGEWVKQRRKLLDLTRNELAKRVGCASVTINKIERDERRPSLEIAKLLAKQLRIPSVEQKEFIQRARGTYLATFHSPTAMPIKESTQTPQQPLKKLDFLQTEHVTEVEFPLIGRDLEWQQLLTMWQSLTDSHMVCIGGVAGIGKTRLAEELMMQVEKGDFALAHARCHALQGKLAYSPIVDWLRSATIQSILPHLGAMTITQIARLLPELLENNPTIEHPQPLLQEWQRKHFFDALNEVFLWEKRPFLLILDDLQWCDKASLEWLQYFLERTNQPVLVVGTVRTDEIGGKHPLHHLTQRLGQNEKVTEISLSALSQSAVIELAKQVNAQTAGHQNQETFVSNTGGNPLFTIETVRAVEEKSNKIVQSFFKGKSEQLEQNQVAMPHKMYAVIRSRFSELSPVASQIAQLGAVIGRAFDLNLLRQASGKEDDAVYLAIEELWQRKLIRQLEGVRFDFRHDRIRDVAYAEISKIEKLRLHRKTAMGFETVYAKHLAPYYGEIAAHYEYAGLFEQAIRYYENMADEARKVYAIDKSINCRQKTVTLMQKLPRTKGRDEKQVKTLIQIGWDQLRFFGNGEKQSGATWQQAYELAQEMGSTKLQFAALTRLSNQSRLNGRWRESSNLAYKALALPQEGIDSSQSDYLKTYIAHNNVHLGKLQLALSQYKKLQATYKARNEPFTYFPYGHCLWLLGYPERAVSFTQSTLQLTIHDPLNHQSSLPQYMNLHNMTLAFCRDVSAVKKLALQQIETCQQQNHLFFHRFGQIFYGWVLAQQGDFQDGVSLIQKNVDALKKHGNLIFDQFRRTLLIDAYLLAAKPEYALDEIEQLLAFADEQGNVYLNGLLYTFKGLTLAQLRYPVAEIEHCYLQALEITRYQKARSLELRASIPLAELWHSQGKTNEAYQLLSEIYNWFEEGFDTADLKQTKRLLDRWGNASPQTRVSNP